jgi:hypothetical protein
MKKNNLISTVILALAVTVFLIINPLKAFSQKQSNTSSKDFPKDVSNILSNSCIGCHGDGGKKMAMSVWDFNKWQTYSTQKQSKKAKKICSAITKGKMPPSSVKKTNPEMIPTTAQKNTICNWAHSLDGK